MSAPRSAATRAVALAPVRRLNRVAEQWGSSFGYGISDELVGFAELWNERAAEGSTDSAS